MSTGTTPLPGGNIGTRKKRKPRPSRPPPRPNVAPAPKSLKPQSKCGCRKDTSIMPYQPDFVTKADLVKAKLILANLIHYPGSSRARPYYDDDVITLANMLAMTRENARIPEEEGQQQ